MKIKLSQRAFLVALALLVLMNSFGSFALAYAQVGIHRISAAVTQAKEKPEQLLLSAGEFSSISWIGRQDFLYRDKVYDCEKIAVAGGKFRISCIADEEETSVKNSIAKDFDSESKNIPSSKALKKLFKASPVFSENKMILLPGNFVPAPVSYFSSERHSLLSAALALQVPPPKIG